MASQFILLHTPAPFDWIALTPDELGTAQTRARDLIAPLPMGSPTETKIGAAMSTLLSAEAAAAVLGVDASWLARAAREGVLPHVRLGKYVRFDPAAIIGQCTKLPRRP
jgi:excisionase family DNA binding protein